MHNYFYVAPGIVALMIFLYMSYLQKKRRDKRRERIHKRTEELMNALNIANKQIKKAT